MQSAWYFIWYDLCIETCRGPQQGQSDLFFAPDAWECGYATQLTSIGLGAQSLKNETHLIRDCIPLSVSYVSDADVR